DRCRVGAVAHSHIGLETRGVPRLCEGHGVCTRRDSLRRCRTLTVVFEVAVLVPIDPHRNETVRGGRDLERVLDTGEGVRVDARANHVVLVPERGIEYDAVLVGDAVLVVADGGSTRLTV